MESMQALLEYLVTEKPYLTLSLLAIGLLVPIYALAKIFLFTADRLVLQPIEWDKIRSGGQGWAVITGATDGIGLEFARAFHQRNINVVLVGRNSEKLSKVANEIKSGDATIETLILDFNTPDWLTFKNNLTGKKVTVLVNAAGLSHEHPKFFWEESEEQIQQIITTNCTSTTILTRIIVPQMLSQGFGIIWNVGSTLGSLHCPLYQTYSGSKAYLEAWSRALTQELSGSGVTVELLCTHYVATRMSKVRSNGWSIPTPKQYAQAVLQGHNAPFRSPILAHDLISRFTSMIPSALLSAFLHRQMLVLREKAIAKKTKLA